MANKRMFSKQVIDTDLFLDMPLSTQCLYFQLGMRADDDGFIDKPKSIMRITGAKEDDLKVLIAKSFIIPFESGVIVIRHWRINNYLRNDRYHPTTCIEEMECLETNENGEYDFGIPLGIPSGTISLSNTNSLLEEDINNKKDIKEKRVKKEKVSFVKPTMEEIQEYCIEKNYSIDTEHFYDYYESNGWLVGKNKMKDWKATIRNWQRNSYGSSKGKNDLLKPGNCNSLDTAF